MNKFEILRTMTPEVMKVLNDYIDERIENLRVQLERADPIDMIRKNQGAIFELNYLRKIRDNAVDKK